MKVKALSSLYRNCLPLSWQQKIDVIRGESQVFRPCFESTKSIFIHVPKAAGTSIARAIYGMNVGHRKAIDYYDVSNKKFDAHFSFAFVRNPWDRAVSAYNFVKQNGTGYVQPLPNSIYQSELFDSFERFVLQWLVNADLSKVDVVFEPQYKYICDRNNNIIVDHIGTVENMKSSILFLQKKLNVEIKIANLNQSTRKKDFRSYYNEETKKVIAELYKKDITLFNYSFNG
jgi:hypothetical protein